MRLVACPGAALLMLVAPAGAQAKIDLGVSATPSATVVSPGQSVSFDITVANHGTEPYEAVFVELFSLRGHGLNANNPYTAVSTSQGTCKDNSANLDNQYNDWICEA